MINSRVFVGSPVGLTVTILTAWSRLKLTSTIQGIIKRHIICICIIIIIMKVVFNVFLANYLNDYRDWESEPTVDSD